MSITLTIRDWFNRELSNEQLMLRYAREQQRQLLDQLYRNCGEDLYHFLLSLSNPELAEDVAQQVWIKVIEKRHLYRPKGQFKSWLFTIARRMLIDEIRRCPEHHSFDEQRYAYEIPQSGELACFNHVLGQLPFEQREAFCLQQEGFTLKQIGEITYCSQETVKSRLRYAKQKLNQALSEAAESGEI